MRIVIDGSFLVGRYVSATAWYANSIILRMASGNPSDTFIYVTHAPLPAFTLPGNVSIYYTGTTLIRLLGRWWWPVLLPYVIIKLKARFLIAAGHAHTTGIRIPVFLFLPTLQQSVTLKNRFNQMQQAASIKKVRMLFTASAHDQKYISSRYDIAAGKIHVLPADMGSLQVALTDNEKEAVKVQHAQGVEYFLFAGDIGGPHNLLELLKAFSLFKKWQQSNMQLIIAGYPAEQTDELLQKTASYKYKSDVHILTTLPDGALETLTAAAYAFVYPAASGCFPQRVVPAMQAGVPVITSDISQIRELAGDTVLYAVPDNDRGFAAGMQVLYKDEALYRQLANKARQRIAQTGSSDVAGGCWNLMMQSLQL